VTPAARPPLQDEGKNDAMRLALASLIALTGLATTAFAQTAPSVTPSTMAPSTMAPSTMAPPAATPLTTMPAAPTAAAPAPPAPPPPAPPPPPEPPTDPTAIGVLNVLEAVCIPVVNGGNLAQLAKAAGFRKSSDSFVYKQHDYQLTILPLGSNPHQCHVDIIHPVDPEAPAKPIVIALHNWAAVSRGYSLYRNDKNVLGSQEFTTRSWENDENGQHEALVLTTIRKADGSPSKGKNDTSEMIFSVNPTPAAS
jgi:hypothetical protein